MGLEGRVGNLERSQPGCGLALCIAILPFFIAWLVIVLTLSDRVCAIESALSIRPQLHWYEFDCGKLKK